MSKAHGHAAQVRISGRVYEMTTCWLWSGYLFPFFLEVVWRENNDNESVFFCS